MEPRWMQLCMLRHYVSVAILLYCIHVLVMSLPIRIQEIGTKMMMRLNKLTRLECLGTDAYLYKSLGASRSD
jgi:hypothetical protein